MKIINRLIYMLGSHLMERLYINRIVTDLSNLRLGSISTRKELDNIFKKLISIDVKVGGVLNVPNVTSYVRGEQLYREQISYLMGLLTQEQRDIANTELNRLHTLRRKEETDKY